jgi:hypothetical protein
MQSGRFAAAIGLIAAYAVALQTLFAVFAPWPAADRSGGQILCVGAAIAADAGDPAAPAPASRTFHCVACSLSAGAAILPGVTAVAFRTFVFRQIIFAASPRDVHPQPFVRARNARAPPLTA